MKKRWYTKKQERTIKSTIGAAVDENHKLLIKLTAAILFGICAGGGAAALGISDNTVFVFFARIFATFTSLFTSFLNFVIPLLILSFIAVGLAELRNDAGRLLA